ncbi:MAG: hypothetical protein MZV70_33315 [Desulfobacterales bacterium]|nr:hypothetical protein [Desulfobacterales bacterium]
MGRRSTRGFRARPALRRTVRRGVAARQQARNRRRSHTALTSPGSLTHVMAPHITGYREPRNFAAAGRRNRSMNALSFPYAQDHCHERARFEPARSPAGRSPTPGGSRVRAGNVARRIQHGEAAGARFPALPGRPSELVDGSRPSHVSRLLGLPHCASAKSPHPPCPPRTASSLRPAIMQAPVDQLRCRRRCSGRIPRTARWSGDCRSRPRQARDWPCGRVNRGSKALRSPATGQALLHSPQAKQAGNPGRPSAACRNDLTAFEEALRRARARLLSRNPNWYVQPARATRASVGGSTFHRAGSVSPACRRTR